MPVETKPTAARPQAEAAARDRRTRRPGRRRVTSPLWDLRVPLGDLARRSRRTVVKRYRSQKAVRVLNAAGADRFGYLLGEPNPRWDVLAELGQIEGDAALVDAATAICERRTKVKEAVALLRRRRLGRARAGCVGALTTEVARAIADYRLRHPGTTAEQVRAALALVEGAPSVPDRPEAGLAPGV